MTAAADKLGALRGEIDAIDVEMHDLIMRRTEIAGRVRELKQADPVKIRPAREAQILYRLMERHRGPFPRRELARMWRELIVATLTVEGSFSVTVLAAQAASPYVELARDHFGSFTPMTRHASSLGVIEAVRRLDATVGILPFPEAQDTDPWWRHLLTEDEAAPRIVARLPFIGRHAGASDEEALAICRAPNEATGRDASFLGIEAAHEIDPAELRAALGGLGLALRPVAAWNDGTERALRLVEVDGFVAPSDRRLARLGEALGADARRVLCLGSYAAPLGAEDLDA